MFGYWCVFVGMVVMVLNFKGYRVLDVVVREGYCFFEYIFVVNYIRLVLVVSGRELVFWLLKK